MEDAFEAWLRVHAPQSALSECWVFQPPLGEERWLWRLGYRVTRTTWHKRGWPSVARSVLGGWVLVHTTGRTLRRDTARELVRDALSARADDARRAYDRAQARWQESCEEAP